MEWNQGLLSPLHSTSNGSVYFRSIGDSPLKNAILADNL